MTVSYQYWQDALRGEWGDIHEGDARAGFWRKRGKSMGRFLPVAIWPDESGKLVAICDGKEVDPAEIFGWCNQNPVSEANYRERVETGRWWDEDAAVAESLSHAPENETQDEATLLRDQIAAALAGIHAYAKIEDETAASKAQGLRSRLLELHRDADARREKLVRPHLDAQNAVNKVWQPLVKEAKAGADTIRTALGAYETAQKRAREAAAEAIRKAEEAGQPPPSLPEPPALAPVPEPPKTQIKPAYGRAASKKTIKKAIITDYDRAVVALKSHPEMRELVVKLAQRAVTAGVQVDGVGFEEVIDVV